MKGLDIPAASAAGVNDIGSCRNRWAARLSGAFSALQSPFLLHTADGDREG
jgi:hypothetical protein